MATDEELLIYNCLNDNWNEGNAALPKFYYDDTIKLHDFGNYDAIKIYTLHVAEKPIGLGYTSYRNEVFLTIDIRSKSRDRMLLCRDEIKRIIRSNRKSLTGFNIFKMTSERKVASYINYFQYVLEVNLLNYITTI
jgi:hypothetical protein